jgi:uncharacterized protein involved in exopolysaccharide biosynthesis
MAGDIKIQEKTLFDYWLILYSRKGVIALITLSSVLSAFVLSYLIQPKYEASTVFYISAKPDTLTFLSPSSSEEIKRAPILPSTSEQLQSIYLGILDSRGFLEIVSQEVKKPLNDLRNDIDFRITNEFFIELFSSDKDPSRAAVIANKYPIIFNNFLDKMSTGQTSQRSLELEREIENIQEKLFNAENDLLDFEAKNRLSSINEEIIQLPKEKINLQIDIEKTKVSLKELKVKIIKSEDILKKEAGLYVASLPAASFEQNPLVRRLQKELSDLEASIASSKIDLRDSHPDVLKLRAQYNEKKMDLNTEIRKITESEIKDPDSFHENIRRNIVNNIIEKQTLKAKIAGLEEIFKKIDERLSSLPNLELMRNQMKRKVSLYSETLDNLNLQLEEINAQSRRKTQNVVEISPADIPEEPAFPNITINVIVAGILGLTVAILYCFFLEYIKNIKDPERKWK